MPETQSNISKKGVPPGEPPVLKAAINLTLRTLEERGRLYRNLVVAVSLVSVASLATGLLCWRAWPLAGLILAVPMPGVFFFLDGRRVLRWRGEILEMSENRRLDLTLFVNTISQYKHLPANTVQAMLATLPPSNTTGVKSAKTTSSSGAAFKDIGEWKILAATAILTLALTGLAAALFWQSVWLLAVALGLAVWFVFLRSK